MLGKWFVAVMAGVSEMFNEACHKGTGSLSHIHHPAGLTSDQIDQVVALACKASPYLHVTTWALDRCVCTQVRTSFTVSSGAREGAWRCGTKTFSQSRRHKNVAKVEVCFEGDKGPVAKCVRLFLLVVHVVTLAVQQPRETVLYSPRSCHTSTLSTP